MRLLSIAILFVVIASCESVEVSPNAGAIQSTSYFPLQQGHTITYQVDEMIFRSAGNIVDTLSYQLQEVVAGSFEDDRGDEVFVIDRYTRDGANSRWLYQESWQAFISNNRVIRVEDNLRFVKLRLPIVESDMWDANVLFDDSVPIEIGNQNIDYFKNWQSLLSDSNINININDISLNNAHEVTLADTENNIEIRKAVELYADGIGLVSKIIYVMDTQCFDACQGLPWEQKAEKGHIYRQIIIGG